VTKSETAPESRGNDSRGSRKEDKGDILTGISGSV
nr:hypothetical protein [Tanacetum cinerariifolium]